MTQQLTEVSNTWLRWFDHAENIKKSSLRKLDEHMKPVSKANYPRVRKAKLNCTSMQVIREESETNKQECVYARMIEESSVAVTPLEGVSGRSRTSEL